MADLQQQPTGHCCLQNMRWSLDTPCISGARENERIADGRLAVCREIQPGLSYYFAMAKSIFYSLVPRLKVAWLVWYVIKRAAVQISAVGLLSGLWSAAGTAFVRLHYLGEELSTTVPNCKSSVSALWKAFWNNFNWNTSRRKEKQFLFSISLAFGRQATMPASGMALLLGRTGQQQRDGRSFLRLLYPTPYSSVLSLLTLVFDFILRKQNLQSHHALFQLACCKLAESAPSRGPCVTVPQCHTHGLYFSLSSSNSFTVLIFQRLQTSCRASKSVLGDHFLEWSLGFIKALQLEAQMEALCQNSDICLSFFCLVPSRSKLWVKLPWKSEASQ